MSCINCDLCFIRTNIVHGTGNPNANLMFIGEAPGLSEDRKGLPFVGRAGQHLNTYFKLAGINRENVYITNVVKCRPYYNRKPTVHECTQCTNTFLNEEFLTVKPKLVVLLGNTALQTITKNPDARVTYWPKWFTFNDVIYFKATYHPSASLRDKYWRTRMIEDFLDISEKYSHYNPTVKPDLNIIKKLL